MMEVNHFKYVVIGAVFAMSLSIARGRPAPGEPRLNDTMYETEDWVITTHNALDYGVTPDDDGDDAIAFQKAINACHADGGGVISCRPESISSEIKFI
jgi:hypothetical protein